MITTSQKWLIAIIGVLLIGIFYALSPILTPFIIATLIAYLADPLVNKLQRYRLSRTLAVCCVFFIIILLLFVLLLILVPMLGHQFNVLINNLPELIAWFQNSALPWIQQYSGLNHTLDFAGIKTELTAHWQQASNVLLLAGKSLATSGFALFEFLLNLILVPVVAFYLMRDWKSLISSLQMLLPRVITPATTTIISECNTVLGTFFKGQFIVILILGILYSSGLAITGLNLALLIGMMAGLLSIVPYLGFIVGIVVASLTAILQFHDGIHVLYILIVFAIGHLIENMLLVPLLIGDKIGLHPVAVIFAILAGGQLFGFIGVLIALPVAAILVVCLRHLRKKYISSELYN